MASDRKNQKVRNPQKPVSEQAATKERSSAIRRIQKLASGSSLGGLKIKDLIREGRR